MQGNQSKLDKNENGKIDSQDFKMLRSKKEVGEMGKPSLKAKFEAAMQKERNTVLNRAKERDKDPDWYKKEAIMQKEKSGIFDAFKPSIVKDIERYKKPLKSMSKNKLKY